MTELRVTHSRRTMWHPEHTWRAMGGQLRLVPSRRGPVWVTTLHRACCPVLKYSRFDFRLSEQDRAILARQGFDLQWAEWHTTVPWHINLTCGRCHSTPDDLSEETP